MTSTTRMTIRLDPALKDRSGCLAAGTRQSRSFLAAETDAAYVDRKLSVIEGIEQGLADVKAGRTVPHAEAMAQLNAVIEEAEAEQVERE